MSERIHPSHPYHPLEMVNRGLFTCDGCMMDGIGTRHRCERCNYDLHHECMSPPSSMTFQDYDCQFLERPLPCRSFNCSHKGYCRSCDACGKTVKGFVYHCAKTGLDFHPRCAKLQSEICIGDVIFRLEKRGPSRCAWCKERRLRGTQENIPGWCYVSNHQDYNFHVYCVMDMAMQSSSDNVSASRGTDLSLALRRTELPVQSKSRRNGGSGNKWFKILQIFLKTVLAILIGDPTTIVATTLAHLVTEGFFHAG